MKRLAVAIGFLVAPFAVAQDDTKTLKAEVVQSTEAAPAAPSAPSAPAAGFSAAVCTQGANTRRVELTGTKPCEVHYKKETEQPGHDQVLWSSQSDLNYCATKAQAFVEKLTGWGWSCTKS